MPYSKHFKVIGRARDDEENDDGMLVEVQFEKQVDKEQVDGRIETVTKLMEPINVDVKCLRHSALICGFSVGQVVSAISDVVSGRDVTLVCAGVQGTVVGFKGYRNGPHFSHHHLKQMSILPDLFARDVKSLAPIL